MAKNFKPGQQVIFRKNIGIANEYKHCTPIPDNSIVTIHSGPYEHNGDNLWCVNEYLFTARGTKQAVDEVCLHPLISDSVLEKELQSISEPCLIQRG